MKKTPRRFVLVGCGAMSASWFNTIRNAFADRLELVGLADLFPENARKRADEFASLAKGPIEISDSLEALLTKTKPDVVFDCTVPDAHYANIQIALRAGCDVLTEKPLASHVDQARELVALASETGRLLAVIQNRRHLAGSVAVRQALASGVIGKVHSLYVDFFLAPRFCGFREKMQHVLLLDMAIHTFDQGRYMTGLNPVRTSCHEFNPSGSWYAHGASAVATFEMSDGALFNYRGSWCAQGHPTSWQGSWRIIGEHGTLLWDGENSITVQRVEGQPEGQFIEPVETTTFPVHALAPEKIGHAGIIGEFLDALDTGTEPQTVAHDNILSLAMVESAIRSAESGQWESVIGR